MVRFDENESVAPEAMEVLLGNMRERGKDAFDGMDDSASGGEVKPAVLAEKIEKFLVENRGGMDDIDADILKAMALRKDFALDYGPDDGRLRRLHGKIREIAECVKMSEAEIIASCDQYAEYLKGDWFGSYVRTPAGTPENVLDDLKKGCVLDDSAFREWLCWCLYEYSNQERKRTRCGWSSRGKLQSEAENMDVAYENVGLKHFPLVIDLCKSMLGYEPDPRSAWRNPYMFRRLDDARRIYAKYKEFTSFADICHWATYRTFPVWIENIRNERESRIRANR